MHLASDYIHPFRSAGGRRARCRVWVYLPDDVLDAPVVICSELPNNPGGSVTNSAEVAAGVTRANELPTPPGVGRALIQGEEGRRGETFELVVFSSYDVEDRAPCLGETLDHATVEVLIRQKVQRSGYQKWYGCYGPKK